VSWGKWRDPQIQQVAMSSQQPLVRWEACGTHAATLERKAPGVRTPGVNPPREGGGDNRCTAADRWRGSGRGLRSHTQGACRRRQ
jgi:hypothetical protein